MTKRSFLAGFFALLLLSAAVMVFMALVATKPGATAKPPQERMWVVETRTIVLADLQPTLRLYGRVESPSNAILTAPSEADVLAVPVHEGEDVKAGQLLVRLDPRDLELELAQRAADVAQLEAMVTSEETRFRADQRSIEHEQTLLKLSRQALKRSTTLKQRKLGSDSVLDEARQALARQQLSLNTMQQAVDDHPARLAQLQARLARARALHDQTQLNLERTGIRAPFDGRVAEVMTSPGARVRDGAELLQVYDTSSLEVRAQIPETQVTALRQGLREQGQLIATAMLDGNPLTLKLNRLAGRVRAGRGGVEGLFQVAYSPTGHSAPRIGRFIDLSVQLPAVSNSVAVPGSAIYGTHRVYRVTNQRLEPLEVERVGTVVRNGSHNGEVLYLVRHPQLKDGDQLVTSQLANAIEGLRVEIAESR